MVERVNMGMEDMINMPLIKIVKTVRWMGPTGQIKDILYIFLTSYTIIPKILNNSLRASRRILKCSPCVLILLPHPGWSHGELEQGAPLRLGRRGHRVLRNRLSGIAQMTERPGPWTELLGPWLKERKAL